MAKFLWCERLHVKSPKVDGNTTGIGNKNELFLRACFELFILSFRNSKASSDASFPLLSSLFFAVREI